MEKDYERKRRRRSEEDKARLDELEPGGSEYSLELRKQHKREKAAEKKRRQRARRRMASTLHSPPPFPIYAASSSSTLNPYTDPLGTNLFNLTMSSTASSSSVSPLSMSTTATTTPSSSTPRLMVDTFRGLQVLLFLLLYLHSFLIVDNFQHFYLSSKGHSQHQQLQLLLPWERSS